VDRRGATDPLAEFGSRVRAHREERGLSQEAFAHQVGVHRTYVGSVERGERNVTLRNILKFSDALSVDPSSLVEGLRS
jgi:transcriptional regulator with XRE-family HTH domain